MTLGEACYALKVAILAGRAYPPPPDRPEWNAPLGLPRPVAPGRPNVL